MNTTGVDGQVHKVKPHMWLCEFALWIKWEFHGTLQAKCECEMIAFESAQFSDIIRLNPAVEKEARAYARSFIRGLDRAGGKQITDLYQTPLIEGLWFRLENEYHYRRAIGSTSVSESRPSATSIFRASFRKTWSFGWSAEDADNEDVGFHAITSGENDALAQPAGKVKGSFIASNTTGKPAWGPG